VAATVFVAGERRTFHLARSGGFADAIPCDGSSDWPNLVIACPNTLEETLEGKQSLRPQSIASSLLV